MRPPLPEVVADNPQTLNAVMESIEARRFELPEARGNHAAPSFETALEAMAKVHVQAVGEEMPAAKCCSVADHLVELQPDRSVICGNHSAGTDANNRVNRNAVWNELPHYAHVSGATEPAGAQNKTDANRSCRSSDRLCCASQRRLRDVFLTGFERCCRVERIHQV